MTPIIRRFVIKLLSKDQGSGITKLPNQMQAGFQESMVTEKLVRSGYDPRMIKSETELKMIINRIDASKKQSKEQKDKAMKQLADIMDMKGRRIPPGAKIMGGEAIETEAEIAARMNRENKEAVARMLQKNKMKEVYGDKADEMIEAMKSPGAQKSYKIMQDDLGVKLYGDESFEEIMASESLRALFFYTPLIAAMAGNVGVQSSAIVVQGLANDLIKGSVLKRLVKEVSLTVLNGIILSLLIIGFGQIVNQPIEMSLTISVSMIFVIIVAALIGTAVPIILDKLDIDPAIATGPFITTGNDVIGILLFFYTAKIILVF